MDIDNILRLASIWVLPVLFAVTLHEAAHGWAAFKLGDDTAARQGRVSFNPLRHIDPFGTILLPALLIFGSGGKFMFGYAKPVPVNFWRLFNPRRDMVLVALAGPLTNLALASVSILALHLLTYVPEGARDWVGYNLGNSAWINVLLFIFNMIPLPPLDGGRVAVGLLPDPLASSLARLERAGIFILLGILFILPMIGNQIGMNLNISWWLIGVPAEYVMGILQSLFGMT